MFDVHKCIHSWDSGTAVKFYIYGIRGDHVHKYTELGLRQSSELYLYRISGDHVHKFTGLGLGQSSELSSL
jgi:hypothetical protein